MAARRDHFMPPTLLAMIHLGLGQEDLALDALEQSCEQREGWRTPYLGVFPFFDSLRSEARFQAVLGCLGLDG